MSKLDELIQKLCPNGVEYKSTTELSTDTFWLMPSTPHYIEKGIPYITSKNVKNGKISFEDVSYISEDDYIEMSRNRSIQSGDLLITMIGTIGETAFVEDFTEFYGQNLYLVRLNNKIINPKFYYYYFETQKEKLVSKKNPSSQGYIKAGSVNDLRIPVPPMEVQCEIVHILDQFTLLTAELTAELTARKQQYQVYLNEIMNAESYEKFKLEEYAKIYDGTHSTPEYLNEGVKFISVENIKNIYSSNKYVSQEAFDSYKIKPKIGDVFMTRIGDVGTPAVMTKQEDLAYYVSLALIRPGNKLLPKFLYFYIKSTAFKKELNKYMLHTAVPIKINKGDIGKCKIIIPSLEEQQRIVDILDKFDAYCNDLTQGLPAEIELRKQQYEYYRDKLLSFKELK